MTICNYDLVVNLLEHGFYELSVTSLSKANKRRWPFCFRLLHISFHEPCREQALSNYDMVLEPRRISILDLDSAADAVGATKSHNI